LPSQRKEAIVAEALVQPDVISDAHVFVADVERHEGFGRGKRVCIRGESTGQRVFVTSVTALQSHVWIQPVDLSIVVLMITISLCLKLVLLH